MSRTTDLTAAVCDCESVNIAAAYFWVGKRGEASARPDQDTGMAVPDQTEPNRYVTTV